MPGFSGFFEKFRVAVVQKRNIGNPDTAVHWKWWLMLSFVINI